MDSLCLAIYMVALTLSGHCSTEIPVEMLPTQALLTVYDPYLDPPGGGINGNGDMRFANNEPVSPHLYGQIGACPPHLYGQTIVIAGVGQILCGDSFGFWDGQPVATVQRGYIRVDVFWPVKEEGYPLWNYNVRDWWHP